MSATFTIVVIIVLMEIYLVANRRGAYHQALQWEVHLYYTMVDTPWEAAVLTRTHSDPLSFYFHNEAPFEDDEALVALCVHVGAAVNPTRLGVVVPNLDQLRAKAYVIGRGVPGEQIAAVGEFAVVVGLLVGH